MRLNNIFKLIIAVGVCELAGVVGSIFTVSSIPTWYAGLVKPALNPPAWIFGPAWTTLYLLMGVAAFLIWREYSKLTLSEVEGLVSQRKRQIKVALGIFGVQLFLNAIWSIIFFGFQNPGWAFVDITLLWLAIVGTIIAFYKISRPAALLLLPYILWVSFAGYLNYSIWTLNQETPVACTMDAKLCPDGSYVSRTGPNCEFTLCSSKEEAIINFGKWDNKSLNDFIENSKKDKNTNDRIKYISQGFIGVPYQGNTLVGAKNIPEKFIINLGGVDCSTLSDYVLALVFANDIKDFPEELRLIRYALGKIDFANRNHFFSQWVKNNSNYLSDISDNFTGSVCETKELNKKKEGDYWVDGIEPFIQKICYVPRNIILDKSFESKLKNGDIVGFHTSSIGLDVTHEGIISIKNNEVYLIHASSKYNKVIEEKLNEYLKRNLWSDGLIIVRS